MEMKAGASVNMLDGVAIKLFHAENAIAITKFLPSSFLLSLHHPHPHLANFR